MSACSWLVARSASSARAFSASARACRASSSCLEMVTMSMSAGRGLSWGMLGSGKVYLRFKNLWACDMHVCLEDHLASKLHRTRRIGTKIVKTEIPIRGTSKVYEICLTPSASIMQTIVDWPNSVCYLWNVSEKYLAAL